MCLSYEWDYAQQEVEMNAGSAQEAAQQAIDMIEKHGINSAHDGVSCADTQIGLLYLGDNATDGYEAEVVVRANIQVDPETGKTPQMIGFAIPPGNDPVDEGVHVCQAAALDAFAKPRNKVPVPEYHEAPRYRSLADAEGGGDDEDTPSTPAMPEFNIEARTAVETSEGTIFPFGTSAFAKSWKVLYAMDGWERQEHHKHVGDSLAVAMVKSLISNGVPIDSLFELNEDLDMEAVNAQMPASWTLEQRAAHVCSQLDDLCRLRFIDQFLPSLVPGMDMLIVVPKPDLLDGSFSFTFKIEKLSAEGTIVPLPSLVHNDALDLARGDKMQLVEAPVHLYTNLKGLTIDALDWDQSTVAKDAKFPVPLYSAEELCGTHFGPSETPPETPYQEVQYGHQYHEGVVYRSLASSYGNNWGGHLKACKQLQQHMVGEVHKTHNDRLGERGLGELYVRPGAERELFYTNLEGMEFPPYCCKAIVKFVKPRETVHEMRARTAAAAKARAAASAAAAAAAGPTPMSTDDLGHAAKVITAPTQGEARNTLIHSWYNAMRYADGKAPHRRAFLMIATGLSSFAVANKTYVDGTWIIDDGDLTISALGSKEQNVLLRLHGALNEVNRFIPCVEYNLYLPTALAMMLGQFASSNPMCDEFAFYYAKALQAHAVEVYEPTADLPLVKVNTLLPLSVCYMFALFNQMKDLDQVTNEALDKGVKDWLDAHAHA
tara:strand:+ start:154 stop:2301 length:2148 start_codon:yes stop_codon:yes gene_type:complete